MADVTLPQLGETFTEGTITRWFKQVGDAVAADEPLFEVSTDKVDTEVPSPVAGTLSEIRAQEGDTVDVGTIIAVVGDAPAGNAAQPEAADEPQAEVGAEPATADAPEPEAEPESSEPDSKADTAEAKELSDAPQPDEQPAPASSTETEPPAVEPSPTDESAEETEPTGQASGSGSAPAAADGSGDGATARLLSPVVRRLINEHGLDPASISGTGPGGRITRDDVLDHIDAVGSKPTPPPAEAAPAETAAATAPTEQRAPSPEAQPAAWETPKAAPAPAAAKAAAPAAAAPEVAAGDRDEPVRLSKIRKLTGQHMIMSKAVSPHAFSVVEVDFANVDTTRAGVKAEWKQAEGFSLTYLPFICRAVVDALGDFPHLNASVGADQLVVHGFVDLGIAVDLDYAGLLVPVIRDADGKRLRAIAREIHDLAGRARTRKLSPDEISGGTFTISNNGSAGSVLTMPIINQPQVAILSTDAINRKPVVVATVDGGEAIAVHPVGNLAMSWDHRAFDGAYAAGFLSKVKEILETKDWSGEL